MDLNFINSNLTSIKGLIPKNLKAKLKKNYLFPCMVVSFCVQVDPMFTVPAPPAPGHPGAPGSSLPSAPSFSPPALPTSNPKQLAVRTRSIGTNTQDGGISGALEGDSACLGPCQPGTSVNLEGIVWHETEEGREYLNISKSQYLKMVPHK